DPALRAPPPLFRAADFFAALPPVRPAFEADLRALALPAAPLVERRAVVFFVAADFFAVDLDGLRFAEREAPALREAVRAVRLSVFFAVPVLRPFFAAILTSLEGVRRRNVRSRADRTHVFVLRFPAVPSNCVSGDSRTHEHTRA